MRIKFVLEDGRKVYASVRGIVTVAPEATVKRLDMKRMTREMGYSPDLSVFGPKKFLANPVGLTEIVVEKDSDPFDHDALVQTGEKAQPPD